LEGDLPVKLGDSSERDYSSGKGSPIHSSELPVELQETLIGLLLGDLHCPLQLHTYAAAGLPLAPDGRVARLEGRGSGPKISVEPWSPVAQWQAIGLPGQLPQVTLDYCSSKVRGVLLHLFDLFPRLLQSLSWIL